MAKTRVESRKPRAASRKPKAESRKPEAESRKPEAESRKPEAESRRPKAESRTPRADRSLRIVMVASEAQPFSKTGGLADVATALPKALARLGHDVTLITPRYSGVTEG